MAEQQSIRVAVAQMVSGRSLDDNLAAADALLSEAARAGAVLAVLPENFATFGRARLADLCFSGIDPISDFLQDAARRHQLWLVGGTQPLCESRSGEPAPHGKVFAASCLFDPGGACTARYDKCHLFDAAVADGVGQYRESSTFAPGRSPVVAAAAGVSLGLGVCYDLRFPSYFAELRRLGAQVVALPSAFVHTTGSAHWEVLIRARAIEQQVFMLAANQGGSHDNGRITWGHSMIVDPWGRVLAELSEPGAGITVADLDLGLVAEIRRHMPVVEHVRVFR